MSLPFDNGVHELKLGNSFDPKPKVGFHTIRYDFKPASVDTRKEACVEVGEGNQVTVTVPHVENSGTPHTVFKGNKQNLMKECVLIFNHDTGTFTLEKLASKVTLKKTRLEGSSKAMQHLASSLPNPLDSKKTAKPKRPKVSKTKPSPEKEKEKEKEKEISMPVIPTESFKDLSNNKRVAEMSDSLSSSDDDDMEEVRPARISPPLPPAPPQKAAVPKFQSSSSSSSSSHVRNYGVLDNDLALSESSSDDDSD